MSQSESRPARAATGRPSLALLSRERDILEIIEVAERAGTRPLTIGALAALAGLLPPRLAPPLGTLSRMGLVRVVRDGRTGLPAVALVRPRLGEHTN